LGNLLELGNKTKTEARIWEAMLLIDVEFLMTFHISSRYTHGFNCIWPKFLFDYLVLTWFD